MAMSWRNFTALTSDLAYPSILFPEPFGFGRGCYLVYPMEDRFLHSPVTLRTRRYCFLSHSVLGEVVS